MYTHQISTCTLADLQAGIMGDAMVRASGYNKKKKMHPAIITFNIHNLYKPEIHYTYTEYYNM
jgi:hypothetical protein